MRTLEELRKEINGKQVVWVDRDFPRMRIDAILICPPKGKEVSVKPYGYTPKQFSRKLIRKDGYRHCTIKYVSRPEYCISLHSICGKTRRMSEELADIPIGGEYCFEEITVGLIAGDSPSCPYAP
ncbi:MAG: hypothetical protein KAS32_27330 [Candidatus Peribacteraceae bacterium]|nr:hypothetical protein [Candidatus Peribacteraceae bacterium]